MSGTLAVRRETKSSWERRTPVTPDLVRKLVTGVGLEIEGFKDVFVHGISAETLEKMDIIQKDGKLERSR